MSDIARESVVVSTEVAVSPERAFALFTGEIDTWWGDALRPASGPDLSRAGVLRFEPGPEGRLLEVGPESVFLVGRVLCWEPGRRLTFEWRQGNFTAEQCTVVDVRFEACDGGVRVTLEHSGFETLPADHSARHGHGDDPRAFREMMAAFWRERIERAATL